MATRVRLILLTALVSPALLAPSYGQDVNEQAPLPAVELPVNLERLKRRLAALPSAEDERTRLKLNFYVDVYGRAPRIDPLEGFDIHTGLVPHGGPSHADMMSQWTPEGFNVPVADLGSVLGWFFNR